jgi:hypothetical protein
MAMSPMADIHRRVDASERGYFARTFSKLDRGSLRGSIFALSASAIGSGVLSLPYVFNLCGVGAGLFFLFIASFAA